MSRVLFAVTGSIAAAKATQVVSKLIQNGHEVQIVATPSALKFVGTATWEGFTGRPVITDVFAEGHQMDHIHLARWADLYILCPATAHSLAQWASGSAADLPSTLFLAVERHIPVLIAPAMNKEMWAHPAVQENVATLTKFGVRWIQPEEGNLACGEVGAGRLAEPEKILESIEAALKTPAAGGGEILITAGATREPLDHVRFITNVSTGRTAAHLADHFSSLGYKVTFLHGQGCSQPKADMESVGYSDFSDLAGKLRGFLGERSYRAVIHAAAVSDYSVDEIETEGHLRRTGGKLQSEQDLTLRLKRNPKLVLNLKEWSSSDETKVVAFKLTDTLVDSERELAVKKLLDRPEVDAVVWNDLSGIADNKHAGRVYLKNGNPLSFSTKKEMATDLSELLGRNSWS